MSIFASVVLVAVALAAAKAIFSLPRMLREERRQRAAAQRWVRTGW